MSNPGRRSIRLPGYDYSQPGGYFVTICAYKNKDIFGEVKDCKVVLSHLGELITSYLLEIPHHFMTTSIDSFVVMPNHLHGILQLNDQGSGTTCRATTEKFGRPTRATLPTIIRAYKGAVTRAWRKAIEDPAFIVWQRNYYEQVIRNVRHLNAIRRYIADNPFHWECRT